MLQWSVGSRATLPAPYLLISGGSRAWRLAREGLVQHKDAKGISINRDTLFSVLQFERTLASHGDGKCDAPCPDATTCGLFLASARPSSCHARGFSDLVS